MWRFVIPRIISAWIPELRLLAAKQKGCFFLSAINFWIMNCSVKKNRQKVRTRSRLCGWHPDAPKSKRPNAKKNSQSVPSSFSFVVSAVVTVWSALMETERRKQSDELALHQWDRLPVVPVIKMCSKRFLFVSLPVRITPGWFLQSLTSLIWTTSNTLEPRRIWKEVRHRASDEHVPRSMQTYFFSFESTVGFTTCV